MPAKAPNISKKAADMLAALGSRIRTQRKAMRINATTLAEAAGMSRVTLHRIEKGEASVTIGAYLNAATALGLDFGVIEDADFLPPDNRDGMIPARIQLDEYPQLKKLAWQVQGVDALTPAEALDIYRRNWRHLDLNALEPHEQQLIDALQLGFNAQIDGDV
ncbi:MAG: helix-turn-helix domain-containing protein [Proteobacteria bacterium]|nr:helix-turn-helix domain-containing protein [Pseudomonadota bacterium]MBU1737756.1 helix-turn-helix domain-containing protein [Pseudomonadota bacterium]